VRAALSGWLSSFRARDIDEYMAHYADVLDAYYLSRNTSIARVRVDKERAFAKYSAIDVSLSNIRVQVEPSGQRAVATFIKTYRLGGPDVNPYTGSGLNRFTFTKIGGRWLITGEEDVR
jgi:ketosteroid isomerase-like protein